MERANTELMVVIILSLSLDCFDCYPGSFLNFLHRSTIYRNYVVQRMYTVALSIRFMYTNNWSSYSFMQRAFVLYLYIARSRVVSCNQGDITAKVHRVIHC